MKKLFPKPVTTPVAKPSETIEKTCCKISCCK